jgi:fatty-acid desaturase
MAAGLYVLRMFAITGFYHRYFAHRTFRRRWSVFALTIDALGG